MAASAPRRGSAIRPPRGSRSAPSSRSRGSGIDDAILLMTSLVLNNMDESMGNTRCTVVSNDRFQDYAIGNRLSYTEIKYINAVEEWYAGGQGGARPRMPRRLQQLRVVAPRLGRQLSIDGGNPRKPFETSFVRPEIYIKLDDGGTEQLNTNARFTFQCYEMLQQKLADLRLPPEYVRGFQTEVYNLSKSIANRATGDIFYIVDVENLFYTSSRNMSLVEWYKFNLEVMLVQMHNYVLKRWRGQYLSNEEDLSQVTPALTESEIEMIGEFGYNGDNRVSVVFPVYSNKIRAFERALGEVKEKFKANSFNLVVDTMVAPINIDFINTPMGAAKTVISRPLTPIPEVTGKRTKPPTMGGGKRQRKRLHEMFDALRF